MPAMALLPAAGFPCETAASNGGGGSGPDATIGTILPRAYHSGGEIMTKYFVAALVTAFVAASSAAPGIAQTGDKTEKQEKKLSTQQQKMKDYGAKWKEEKAAKNVKGREAYQKFMSACLKG